MKISIIVPVYNVEEFLSICLDSIINQTYRNLEIILINDGSTDSSLEICLQYAEKDTRIVVLNKSNGGLSDARNAGLNVATGDFISFVDSDDFLSLKFYQTLLSNSILYNADVAECDFIRFSSNKELEDKASLNSGEVKTFDSEMSIELLMREELHQVVWNKLYRREVILEFLFPVNKINEDEFWTYKVFGNSKRIIRISEKLYYYRQQYKSIMGKEYTLKRLDGLEALEERVWYTKKYFPNLENLAKRCFCFACVFHYQQISKRIHIDPNELQRKKLYKDVKKFFLNSKLKNWSRNDLIWIGIFLVSPRLYIRLREYFDNRVNKTLVVKDRIRLQKF